MKNTGQPPAQSFKELIGAHQPPVSLNNFKNSYAAFKNLFKLNVQQYRLLGEHILEGIWIIDGDGRTVYINNSMTAMLGYTPPEMHQISLMDCLDKANLKLLNAYVQNPDKPGHQAISLQKQLTFLKKDHTPLWAMVSVNHIFGITKKLNQIILLVSDVSHSKQAEHRLSLLNRMYAVLCHTHRAIIQIRSLTELCEEICRVLVKDGLFNLVWIGMVNLNTNHIDLIAHCESETGFSAPIHLPDLNNREPVHQEILNTIRAGNIAVVNDIESHPNSLPCRTEALQRGCKSFIIIPIKVSDEAICSISICAGQKDFFNEEEQDVLRDLGAHLSYAIEFINREEQRQNTQKALKESEDRLQDSYRHLNKVMIEIVKSFATTIETRDPYTAGHQDRVSKLAHAIAQEMGLPAAQIDAIILAATIHDIGKLFVPAEILNKPGKISDNEYQLIKSHPQIGYDIIKEIEFTWPIADIILQHHERLDGSGYPNKMAGDFILLEAKIIGVADVVEAMASHRPYRPALGIDKALEEISRNQGVLYDPVVVDVCISLLNQVEFKFG
jgi:PAS domain S-box-containing protein/putative nucleotidyltransferase with HDIG domain